MSPLSDWAAPAGWHSSFPFPCIWHWVGPISALFSPPVGSQGQAPLSGGPIPSDLEGCPFPMLGAAQCLIIAASWCYDFLPCPDVSPALPTLLRDR